MNNAVHWVKEKFLRTRRGIIDVGLSLVPQLVKSATGFLSSILIARGLGPAGMGQYALILSLTDTVTSLSDLGIGQTALRYASLSASQGDSKGQMAVLRWAARLRLLLVTVMIIFCPHSRKPPLAY